MSLKRLLEGSSTVSSASARAQSSHTGYLLESPPSWPPESVTRPVFTRPLGRFLTDHNNGYSERYFGPTSLDSLILDIKDVITERLASETPTLRESALLAQGKIDCLVGRGEEELMKDGSPPTAPPSVILDAMIEPYFATINHHFPIWTKERFKRMATDLRQSTSPERDLASIICCNNLILTTLTANSLCSRRGKPVQNKHQRNTSSMDSHVITGFLRNAERALENMDKLVSPRLINVQALLSLVSP